MGIIRNAREGQALHAALLPLADAADEAQFRAALPAARSAGAQVWDAGNRLTRQGSARDKVLSAAAAPQAAEQLLQMGEFIRARTLVQQCIHDLEHLYG